MRLYSIFSAFSLIGILSSPIASAAVITYTDRSQFLAAIDLGTAVEADFNEFTSDVRFVPSTGPVDAGPFSLLANKILGSAENLEPNKVDVLPFFPNVNVDGTPHAYVLVERDSNLEVTVTFDNPVAAFGAEYNRVDNSPGESLDLILSFQGGGTQTIGAPDPDSFFGFVSDSALVTQFVYQARTANGTQGGTGFGLDNTISGFNLTPVPEASSLAFLAAMFTASLLIQRSRRGHGLNSGLEA